MSNQYQIFLQQPAIPEYLVPLIDELRLRLGDRLFVETALSHQGTFTSQEMLIKARESGPNIQIIRQTALPGRLSIFHSNFDKKIKHGDVIVFAGNPRIISNFIWMRFPNIGTVWWGQGWGSNTSPVSARIRLSLSNIFDVRLFYDVSENDLVKNVAKEPIFYINNTVDYSDANQFQLRKVRHNSLCFIGRLTEKSGVINLPAIANELIKSGIEDLKIGIMGDGPKMEIVKKKIKEYDVENYFDFHGSIFNRNEASKVLNNYCFMIYPGSIGLSTQHALSEGLPIITHRNFRQHNPEARLLEDGVNSFLCSGSIPSFVSACISAFSLTDCEFVKIQKASLKMRSTHSIAHMADAFIRSCDKAHELSVSC